MSLNPRDELKLNLYLMPLSNFSSGFQGFKYYFYKVEMSAFKQWKSYTATSTILNYRIFREPL